MLLLVSDRRSAGSSHGCILSGLSRMLLDPLGASRSKRRARLRITFPGPHHRVLLKHLREAGETRHRVGMLVSRGDLIVRLLDHRRQVSRVAIASGDAVAVTGELLSIWIEYPELTSQGEQRHPSLQEVQHRLGSSLTRDTTHSDVGLIHSLVIDAMERTTRH